MTARRLAGLILCGTLCASRAVADPIAYETLDDRSKAAIAESCASWVLRENPELVAFWMDSIAPLCAAAQPAAQQPSAVPAQTQ